MMEGKELRIGNRIRYSHHDVTVKEILSTYGGWLKTEEAIDGVAAEYDGIQLTESLLEGIGKKSKSHCGAFTWGKSCFYRLKGRIAVYKDDDDNFYIYYRDNMLCSVYYLHQLQNLYFALTNQELTKNGLLDGK